MNGKTGHRGVADEVSLLPSSRSSSRRRPGSIVEVHANIGCFARAEEWIPAFAGMTIERTGAGALEPQRRANSFTAAKARGPWATRALTGDLPTRVRTYWTPPLAGDRIEEREADRTGARDSLHALSPAHKMS